MDERLDEEDEAGVRLRERDEAVRGVVPLLILLGRAEQRKGVRRVHVQRDG